MEARRDATVTKEMDGCTFQPQINKSSRRAMTISRYGDERTATDRLYGHGEMSREQLDQYVWRGKRAPFPPRPPTHPPSHLSNDSPTHPPRPPTPPARRVPAHTRQPAGRPPRRLLSSPPDSHSPHSRDPSVRRYRESLKAI